MGEKERAILFYGSILKLYEMHHNNNRMNALLKLRQLFNPQRVFLLGLMCNNDSLKEHLHNTQPAKLEGFAHI